MAWTACQFKEDFAWYLDFKNSLNPKGKHELSFEIKKNKKTLSQESIELLEYHCNLIKWLKRTIKGNFNGKIFLHSVDPEWRTCQVRCTFKSHSSGNLTSLQPQSTDKNAALLFSKCSVRKRPWMQKMVQRVQVLKGNTIFFFSKKL